MRKILTILGFLSWMISSGQFKTNLIHEENNSITKATFPIIDSISPQDVTGTFTKGDGFGGFMFQLDSNMTFNKIDFSCEARFRVDSGSWIINNKTTLILKSNKTTMESKTQKRLSFIINNSSTEGIEDNFYTLYRKN